MATFTDWYQHTERNGTPKKNNEINSDDVERTLSAVIDCVDFLFICIYGKGLPAANVGLQSKYTY